MAPWDSVTTEVRVCLPVLGVLANVKDGEGRKEWPGSQAALWSEDGCGRGRVSSRLV